MKLRNRKTDKIGNLVSTNWDEVVLKVLDDNGVQLGKYNSLAKLNAEWEDYEEPQGYWYISEQGIPGRINFSWDSKESIENHKEIGNYFETYEEVEKAVEKLKAIKILKDNGFRFIQWEFDMETIADGKIWFDVGINTQWDAEQLLKHRSKVKKSLDLLFGGEDEQKD